MAIRIPILTSFDPKGLKAANTALAGLSSSVTSLTRNFALVGAGIAAGTALLGKAVMSASQFEAEFEGVNQVFKEAAGSVQAFADQAAKSAGLSATEALQASKTFGLFATGAGLGVQEAAKFSTTMVQLAGDLGSFNDVPTADALAAIQSGLMGQSEPLRRFGVFLDAARLRQEALNMGIYNGTGPLTTQQKMMASYSAILAQTTVQQGDFVAYGDTLGNQLKTISGDFQNLTKDIGQMLIPVITEAMPQIKEMALVIGEQLKKAIGSIDWKATIQAVIDFTSFLVANAETIAKVVAAIFILNTAFKLMAVASGIAKVAIALQTWVTAQLATGMTIATVATNILSAAMRLIPFVAIATGIALVVNGIMNIGNEAGKSSHNVRVLNGQITAGADKATASANQYVKVAGGFRLIENAADDAADAVDAFNKPKDSVARNRRNALREENRRLGKIPGSKASSGLFDFSSLLSTFTGDAASSGGGSSLVDELNKELDKLAKEAERAAREAEKSMQKIEADAQAERERAAAAEQAVLDQRQNAYQSFTDSVKQLFGQIKDSILSSFNLPTLGNSVNSITRNIGKLLERTKGFASSISRLSGMGLNSALLQQVIQAGPMQGSQLAAALVGGGAGFINQLNRAYGEFGDLAGGIAGVGTTGAFAGQQTINNYSIAVTGGLATGADVGRAVVNAISSYERQSGAAWRA
jgi:hypothetical protein